MRHDERGEAASPELVPIDGEHAISDVQHGLAHAVLAEAHYDILVVEADHETAGYLAWADEAPGVAVIRRICIGSPFRRYGIATRLLREVASKAAGHDLPFVLAPAWSHMPSSLSFLASRGFMPVDQGLVPEPIATWCAQTAPARIREGEVILWRDTETLGHVPGLPRP